MEIPEGASLEAPSAGLIAGPSGRHQEDLTLSWQQAPLTVTGRHEMQDEVHPSCDCRLGDFSRGGKYNRNNLSCVAPTGAGGYLLSFVLLSFQQKCSSSSDSDSDEVSTSHRSSSESNSGEVGKSFFCFSVCQNDF